MNATDRMLRPLLAVALALALGTPRARADDPAAAPAAGLDLRLALAGAGSPLPAAGALTLTLGADEAPRARGGVWFRLHPPFEAPDWQPRAAGTDRNSWLALGEVVGINVGMWFVSYWAGNSFSKISFDTIGQNFKKGWIIDTDPYWVNQFGHPYEGQAFYTAGRSTGHGFYTSFGFAFLGSLMWEQMMEVQSPSINDQVTTPAGGAVMGEVLWRMHRLILDSAGAKPSWSRQLAAFVVSPVAGVNEFFFGDKYSGPVLLPPSWVGEFRLGLVFAGTAKDLGTNIDKTELGPWVSIGAHITYGVPGTPGLRLKEPFDHFEFLGDFDFTSTAQRTAKLLMRGLLVGETIGPATDWGGLWGLFGSYDVISVPVFATSGFGVGPGVTLMKRWGSVELYGTGALEALPWASGGNQDILFARDYHVGPGALALVEFRGVFADRVTVDLQGREYFISGAYAKGATEDISWSRASVMVRIAGPHGVTATVDWTRRHASYPDTVDVSQRGAIYSAYYTVMDGW